MSRVRPTTEKEEKGGRQGRLFRGSLSLRLGVLLLLMTAAVFTPVLAVVSWMVRAHEVDNAETNLKLTSDNIILGFSEQINSLISIMKLEADDPSFQKNMQEANPDLRRFNRLFSASEYWISLHILDPQGRIIAGSIMDQEAFSIRHGKHEKSSAIDRPHTRNESIPGKGLSNSQRGSSMMERPHVQSALAPGGKLSITKIPFRSKFRKETRAIGLAIPVLSSEGKLMGCLAGEVDLTAMAYDHVLSHDVGQDGYLVLMDGAGTTIAHRIKKFVGRPAPAIILEKMRDEPRRGLMQFDSVDGRRKILSYRSLEENIADLDWSVALVIPVSSVEYFANRILLVIVGLQSLTGLALVCAMLFVVRYVVVRRIFIMNQAFIKAANRDLTTSVPIRDRDEIALAGSNFNLFVSNASSLIHSVQEKMKAVGEMGISLASHVEQTSNTVNKIELDVVNAKTRMDDHAHSVTETTAAVDQISQHIAALQQAIQNQANNIEQSSANVEEMMANVTSLNQVVDASSDDMEKLRSATNVGKEKQLELLEQIRSVAKDSQSLQEANTLIGGIASQTNLLSMNAAIEAAHAGESGKGFAVVAGEIRKLAEEATIQSNNIKKIISIVVGDIDQAVSLADVSGKAFAEVASGIQNLGMMFAEIRQNMEEQASGTKEGLESLTSMKSVTAKVQSGSVEMTASNKKTVEAVSRLDEINQAIVGTVSDILDGLKEIHRAMDSVRNLSAVNKEDVQEVLAMTDRFQTTSKEEEEKESSLSPARTGNP